MKYGLWNETTRKWVLNDDGSVCLSESAGKALDALDRVNDIKQLNPKHRKDEIVIRPFVFQSWDELK